MTRPIVPNAFLEEWGRLLPVLEHVASTRYRIRDWSCTLTLPLKFTWESCGFTPSKLTYLLKHYPMNALTDRGCIESVVGNRVTYRRVDLIKGWMADVLYLQHLGFSGPVEFVAPGFVATIHAVRLSCVFPLIPREGFFNGTHSLLRKTLRRALIHRLERRYESYGQAARANRWAHALCDSDDIQKAIDLLVY